MVLRSGRLLALAPTEGTCRRKCQQWDEYAGRSIHLKGRGGHPHDPLTGGGDGAPSAASSPPNIDQGNGEDPPQLYRGGGSAHVHSDRWRRLLAMILGQARGQS